MVRNVVSGVGRRVRELRMAKGMKQAVLARRSRISESYLSDLENSEYASPSALVLHRIAVALDTGVAYLLGVQNDTGVEGERIVPPTLLQAQAKHGLSDEEVALLSRIEYRDKRPQTVDDWVFLLSAIRLTVH